MDESEIKEGKRRRGRKDGHDLKEVGKKERMERWLRFEVKVKKKKEGEEGKMSRFKVREEEKNRRDERRMARI